MRAAGGRTRSAKGAVAAAVGLSSALVVAAATGRAPDSRESLAPGAFFAPAYADDSPRDAGAKLRDALRAAPPRDALTPEHPKDGPPEGEVRLAAYLGLARVGDVTLHTQIEDKGGEKLYVIEDRLDFDTPGLGNVHALVTGDLGPDLSVRDLVLETEGPTVEGPILRRRVAVSLEGSSLVVTETRNEGAAEKRTLEGVDPRALLLTPPLGVGERLVRLAKGEVGSRLSFDAFDLSRGKACPLTLSFEEQAKTDVRGESVLAQKVTREEGAASLESWLDLKTREPLKLLRSDATAPRVVFVGREGPERRDLPAPPASARATEGPRETVLRFLRATGDPDLKTAEPEILSVLDVDALYARATDKPVAGVDPKDPRFRRTFERALLGRLTSDEWRKGDTKKILAGATRPDDLSVEESGDKATVRPKDRPDDAAFELRKTDAGWKIVAFPGG